MSSLFLAIILVLAHLQPVWLLKLIHVNRLTLMQVIVIAIICIFVSIISLVLIGAGTSLFSRLRFAPFLVISWLSTLVIFLYSDQPFVIWPLIILITAMNWIWLESLYLFWQRPKYYQPYSLQRIANYAYLIELFLLVTAVIGLQILIQVPLWQMLLVIMAVVWAIQYDYFLLHKLDKQEGLIIALIGTIMAGELYLVLNLLPTHFYMYGIIISLFFYIWLGICKQVLRRKKDLKYIKVPIILGSAGIVVSFVTSLLIR